MSFIYVINITRQRYIPIINAQISISRIFNKTSAMSHLAERIEASNKKKEKKRKKNRQSRFSPAAIVLKDQ